ncbi:cysteinyl-tRNA synthetase [Paenibacillus swuensis]|uniref:Cysteine--tRNA ligase n=1 Tax=Paenibacillus swuensis TaxID=1178515 RepID=A0A172TIZ9_9BACL|nr:cysteine--tRNA ligase [Paenibacillus swuensis]ANE46763.1 cysteinyl-tRNA synthetase [Paenibacillus swuensis]
MTLHIFNTMSREKEPFVPLEPGKVKMYVCGPTVYNYIHIGNARPAIFFDVVRRYLAATGYDVTYVLNFTDVDDKMIRKAEELGETVPQIAEKFIGAYYEDVRGLGIQDADIHPRVTETMDEIIEFIQGLLDKGYAYVSEGDVNFRTSRFEEYGKLSHQNLDELQFGIRIGVDERKENAQDFVLWKNAKPGEIHWKAPWGEGRPGWHIECSAMIKKYLGTTIDIHGGGHDLTFPHHECEIAQTESYTGEKFVNYWMHNGYININNEKMSKSLGNGINVVELRQRTKPQAIRYFMLSGHYRSPLNFSEESLKQAENSVERIWNSYGNLQHRYTNAAAIQAVDGTFDHPEITAKLEEIRSDFYTRMNDDFSTPDAITALFNLVAETNLYLQQGVVGEPVLRRMLDLFQEFDAVLGILEQEIPALLDEEIERLLTERVEARQAKNWARADEIRDMLTEKGILLEDTPQGMRWRRK